MPDFPRSSLKRWRRLRIEPLADYRVFGVYRVELEDSDGRPRGDAFTVRCGDWCNVVAVTPEDRLVMVWQYRFGSDALSLEIPGGVIDPGESPQDAARRELREETGYDARQWEPLSVVEANPAIQNNRCFTFLATGARRVQGTQFDHQEELETTTVPVAKLPELLDGGHVAHSLVHSALEAYLRRRRADQMAGEVDDVIAGLEDLQAGKVLDLARRLRPGVTPEDIGNPHDFPELGDPDWQYADGVLAGIRAVRSALRAKRGGG